MDDDEDHSETLLQYVYIVRQWQIRQTQQNPLILQMNVENGSTIQLPIGNTDDHCYI